MLKRANKKTVTVFFVVVAFMQVSTIKPSRERREWLEDFLNGEHYFCCLITLGLIYSPFALSNCLNKRCSKGILCLHKKILQSRLYYCFFGDPCKKPSTGTKITDLFPDCLCEIFDFYAPHNCNKAFSLPRDFVSIRALLSLRLVCKRFEEAVQKEPLSFFLNCNGKKKIDPSRLSCFGKIGGIILSGSFSSSIKENGLEALQGLQQLYGSGLEQLTSLQKLKVSFCKNFNWNVLEKLTNLRTFEVVRCGKAFDESMLKKLINLRELTVIGYNEFTGSELEELKYLQKLTVFYNRNGFSDLKLSNFINLEKLSVRHCKKFAKAAVKKLENLQELELRACDNFDWSNFQELKKLRILDLWIGKDKQNDNLDETSLGKLTNLQKLKVYWYRNFTGMILEKLINLQELKLCGCYEFTGEGLKNTKNLRRIEMTECDKFDGKWVENLKSLRFLKVL